MTIDLDALEKLADEVLDAAGDLAFAEATAVPGWKENSTSYRDAVGRVGGARNAFILSASPTTIKALIAELKEARRLLQRWQTPGGQWSADIDTSAFLARNGTPTRDATKAES